jgi:hypothetical protein
MRPSGCKAVALVAGRIEPEPGHFREQPARSVVCRPRLLRRSRYVSIGKPVSDVDRDLERNHLVDHTLLETWNGSRWSVTPSPGTGAGELFGVSCIPKHNCQAAVGDVFDPVNNAIQALVLMSSL